MFSCWLYLLIVFLYTSVVSVSYQSSDLNCLRQRDRLSEGLTKGRRSSWPALLSAFGGRRFVPRRGPRLLGGAAVDGGFGTMGVTAGVLLGTAGGRGEGWWTSWNCSSLSTNSSTLVLTDWSQHPSATSLPVQINSAVTQISICLFNHIFTYFH